MIQKAKNEVFGHFLEFGLLDRLDIAYCDSFTNFRQCYQVKLDHSEIKKNAFMNDPKSQKGGFWPFSGVQSVYQVLKFKKIIELLSSTVLTCFTGLTSLTV